MPRALPLKEADAVPIIAREKEELFERDNWFLLERTLRDYMRGICWFRGEAREIRSADIKDVIPIRFGQSSAYIVLIQVEYTEGEPETYVMPLTTAPMDKAGEITSKVPHSKLWGIMGRGSRPTGLRTGPLSSPQQAGGYPAEIFMNSTTDLTG